MKPPFLFKNAILITKLHSTLRKWCLYNINFAKRYNSYA
ncbi:hypothetical protein CAter10_4850 [Collimonas arenae]|nr:hypothetical protein CAter10_4850 [Collimonas arenae]